MSKLNLASLAQNEVTKEEAQRVKGGVVCLCVCTCSCPPEYKVTYRIDAKMEDLIPLRDIS